MGCPFLSLAGAFLQFRRLDTVFMWHSATEQCPDRVRRRESGRQPETRLCEPTCAASGFKMAVVVLEHLSRIPEGRFKARCSRAKHYHRSAAGGIDGNSYIKRQDRPSRVWLRQSRKPARVAGKHMQHGRQNSRMLQGYITCRLLLMVGCS